MSSKYAGDTECNCKNRFRINLIKSLQIWHDGCTCLVEDHCVAFWFNRSKLKVTANFESSITRQKLYILLTQSKLNCINLLHFHQRICTRVYWNRLVRLSVRLFKGLCTVVWTITCFSTLIPVWQLHKFNHVWSILFLKSNCQRSRSKCFKFRNRFLDHCFLFFFICLPEN